MGWSRWVGAALVAASSVGFSGRSLASPPPHALGVRLPCIPDGAGPSTGGGVQCGRLSGWFDGRVEWLSAGQVVFVEEGPFHGSPAATGEVQVELDANHDDALFERIYGSTTLPAPSILSAPDLSLRLLLKDADGRLTTVVEQRYTPEAVAFWSRHSEDTIQLASSIDSERAARAAGDERLAATIDSESAARRAADLDTLAA